MVTEAKYPFVTNSVLRAVSAADAGSHALSRLQISRAVLDEQRKFRMPKWLEEDKPPVTKEELEEKINQLHSAINDVATSIGSDEALHSAPSNGSKPLDAVTK